MWRLCGTLLLLVAGAEPCSVSYIQKLWAKKPGSESRLFAFERDGKVGFIDPGGNVVIKPTIVARIDDVGDFSNGLARVNRQGYVDETGRLVVKEDVLPQDDPSERFSERLAPYEVEGKPAVRKLRPGYFFYRSYPGLKGFVDSEDNVVITAQFADVGPFRGGLARAVLDGYCYVATNATDRKALRLAVIRVAAEERRTTSCRLVRPASLTRKAVS